MSAQIEDNTKDEPPRKLPASIVAVIGVATISLAFPLIYQLRRRPGSIFQPSLQDAPRRSGRSTQFPITSKTTLSTQLRSLPIQSKSSQSSLPKSKTGDFNPAFYTAKAFGIATVLISLGAVVTIWGVKKSLGVHTTEEFAQRMRLMVVKRMPQLTEQIHRLAEPESEQSFRHDLPVEWSWPDAEKRLKSAFEHGGFMGWAQAALTELEAEGRLERHRRSQGAEIKGKTVKN